MTDVVTFLYARLDEDEQMALRAQPGPWSDTTEEVGFDYLDYIVEAGREYDDASVSRGDRYGHCNAQHIARHDPARVLREVEAKRQIVGWWAETGDWNDRGRIQDPQSGEWCRLPILPPVLEALAQGYADHPDFSPDWRL